MAVVIYRILALGLAVLLGLIAVALLRTLLLKAKTVRAERLSFPVAEVEANSAALARLLRIPTISAPEDADLSQFSALHRELELLFPLVHQHLSREVLSGSLLYHWAGTGKGEAIVLMAHQDVVPAAEEGWLRPPFAGERVEAHLYGRGAIDIKNMLFAELKAVENLLAQGFSPSRDLYLAYSINEETSGAGAGILVAELERRGVRALLVLDEGGAVLEQPLPGVRAPYAMVGLCEKGYIDARITALGRGGHSSTPPRGNPWARLAEFMRTVEHKRPFKKHFSPELKLMFSSLAPHMSFGQRFIMGNLWLTLPLLRFLLPRISPFGEAMLSTTCVFTMAQGSEASNVIPSKATVIANLRCSPQQNVEETLAALAPYLKANELELEVLQARSASPVADVASPVYAQFCQVISSSFPDCSIAPYFVLGGTDARFYHAISDLVLRFAPFRLSQAELASMHSKDERIEVKALTEGVHFLTNLIKSFAS